jgi:hypothetical protein
VKKFTAGKMIFTKSAVVKFFCGGKFEKKNSTLFFPKANMSNDKWIS